MNLILNLSIAYSIFAIRPQFLVAKYMHNKY